MKVGLISDTHGVVDAAVAPYFSECDAILHAGDVGHHGGETGERPWLCCSDQHPHRRAGWMVVLNAVHYLKLQLFWTC